MPVTTITTKTRARIGKDPVPPRPMTVEEYARFEEPEDGYRYELVRGILTVQEPGPGYPHGFLQADLTCGISETGRAKPDAATWRWKWIASSTCIRGRSAARTFPFL